MLYGINIFRGRKANDAVALAWVTQFCEDGAVLDRNFSLLGTGNNSGEVWVAHTLTCSMSGLKILPRYAKFPFPHLSTPLLAHSQAIMRQSNHSFLFYTSGRRFCSALKATLELRRRQDLFAQLWYCISSRPDFVDIEVAMNEGAMPPMVSVDWRVSE